MKEDLHDQAQGDSVYRHFRQKGQRCPNMEEADEAGQWLPDLVCDQQ
jgi:hypothetical protein